MSAPLSSNYPRSGRSQSPALAFAERASKQDRAEAEMLRAALGDVLLLARIKWGNLDADANKIFERAEQLLKE